jgi:hypothetical protein
VDTLKNMNVLNGIQREEIAYFLIGPKIVLEWPSFVAIVKSWMTTVKDKLERCNFTNFLVGKIFKDAFFASP